MINKIYKRIHIKYLSLFKFIFFLRYLLGIFLISSVLFFTIPHFFDLKKKDEIIKNYLFKSYGLTLKRYENIQYNFLPKPNLEIKNAEINIMKEAIKMDVGRLLIYPKLLSIYNYENFEADKIVLNKNKILLSDSNFKIFIDYIYNLKKKFKIKNLDLEINKNKKSFIGLRKIYFTNYGYNKYIITGEIFNKKFKALISENYDKINFKLFKTGLTADINFDKIENDSKIRGIFKSKMLNSKLRFNFEFDDKKFEIYNSYFRNKDLSFNNKSTIVYSPFFSFNSIFKIEDINAQLLKNIDINKIIISKDIIKKLNTKNEINFKSKKFNGIFIDDFNLEINLAYGRLIFSKKILVSNNIVICAGDINLLEDYPILFFNCSLISNDKKKLLKKFSIKYKNKNESFKLDAQGNINILNKKINFKLIKKNQDYVATKEDLIYFKKTFETIIFDKNFYDVFNFKKIKEFIIEIS